MSDDAHLLDAWRAGDDAAGESLVARHYDTILRFFRTKAGDDADDLVQRTFLRCAEPKTVFRGQSSFRAFLYGIARNVLLEHIRACIRDRKVDPDFGVSSILDLTPRASTVAFARAQQRQLVQALQRLPVELQIALELYYWEELSIDEIAAAVEIPSGTVKSRLYRGRTLLREMIDNAPPDSGLTSVRNELAKWLADTRAHSSEAPDKAD
ncbi:MAG: RNA polymerase sigma factor [Myxococcales bacterium]|nr:RNA polymerase sigma factor [Myxococcales bacterium]